MAVEKQFQLHSQSPLYNKRVYDKDSIIDCSSYRELDLGFECRNFSIKYVVSGTEHYTIEGNSYTVKANNYLLCTTGNRGAITIDSKLPVKGICIDLSADLLSEVASACPQLKNHDILKGLQHFLTTDFPENQYTASRTELGRCLLHIESAGLEWMDDPAALQEFFYGAAEAVITDQYPNCMHYQQLGNIKVITRKDLFRRLLKGKDFIDDCFRERLTIGDIAREATLSDYHFLRLFRKAFRQSPYQYLISRRLAHADMLLNTTDGSVSDIACQAGFTDIYSFSKTYKKRFGYSPKQANVFRR